MGLKAQRDRIELVKLRNATKQYQDEAGEPKSGANQDQTETRLFTECN